MDKDWDWGTVSPYFTPEPIIVGDEIWFYYMAQNGRNWWTYTGDPPRKDPKAKEPRKGVGLATLRLDGFVSVETEKQGTLTTKPLLFLGDTLIVNANAKGGSLGVEALDSGGDLDVGADRHDPPVADHDGGPFEGAGGAQGVDGGAGDDEGLRRPGGRDQGQDRDRGEHLSHSASSHRSSPDRIPSSKSVIGRILGSSRSNIRAPSMNTFSALV